MHRPPDGRMDSSVELSRYRPNSPEPGALASRFPISSSPLHPSRRCCACKPLLCKAFERRTASGRCCVSKPLSHGAFNRTRSWPRIRHDSALLQKRRNSLRPATMTTDRVGSRSGFKYIWRLGVSRRRAVSWRRQLASSRVRRPAAGLPGDHRQGVEGRRPPHPGQGNLHRRRRARPVHLLRCRAQRGHHQAGLAADLGRRPTSTASWPTTTSTPAGSARPAPGRPSRSWESSDCFCPTSSWKSRPPRRSEPGVGVKE